MTPREFAVAIVTELQEAGYQALWAGGCVRDSIVGLEPKDYDIATNAKPDQVRQLFGKNKTIAVGAAFGVITVIGSKRSGNIEVATFRRDAEYSDGRHPDSVEFTDAREDALRRDFTINGLFYDPLTENVIDYVNGKADIECRIVRAIGDPEARISEDKLRMLRAIRFAATYGFELANSTMAAIQRHCSEIDAVSGERIGNEIRRMLIHDSRSIACSLLQKSGLLAAILKDGELLYKNRANWQTRLQWLGKLDSADGFEPAAFLLLSRLINEQGIEPTVERWKLSNAETATIVWLQKNLLTLSRAHHLPWSQIQPLLIQRFAQPALAILRIQFGREHPGVQFCSKRLKWEPLRLDPPPLIAGADLQSLGIAAGPIYSQILQDVRAAQLDKLIDSRDQAIDIARKAGGEHRS